MKVTVLGCGGSMGVPMVGNVWGDCDPAEPRNQRSRASIMVETGQVSVLVDTTPDLRSQLLAAGVTRVDAVLYTHEHADHLHGIDDLRPFTFRQKAPIPAYASPATKESLESRFAYAVASVSMDRWLYKAIVVPQPIDGAFCIGDLGVEPFEQSHGNTTSYGFRFGPFAYSTDAAELDDAAFAALDGVDTWLVDATREEPHPSHSHLARTLEWIARLKPRQAFITHMNHTMDYRRLERILPPGVAPAYDGMVLEFG
jgi:phosphoribosyl 1,2-cyclic phosphate phosphodiesterase